MDDKAAIEAKIDAAARLMFAKDMAIVDELWSDGFRLVGSEVGEMAASRDELEALIAYLFSLPFKLRWVFNERPTIIIENDIAWTFSEMHVHLVCPDKVINLPYRLVTIFGRENGAWKWRLYSGSEPEPTRTRHCE